MSALGNFLENQKSSAKAWLMLYFGILAFLVAGNLFLKPEEPHFILDILFGFWPAFGLGFGVAMIFIMKRIVQPLIFRSEDYYNDI